MRRFLESGWFMGVVHMGALAPFAWIAILWATGKLEPDPILALELASGRVAITLLVLTLAVTPLARLLHLPVIWQARLPLGLYTAGYASLHVLILIGLDYGFNLSLFLRSYASTTLFWLGLATLLILLVLAITSPRSIKLSLGRWWKPLHRLVYLAAILDVAHYFLAVKGNLLTLSGNLLRPLVYATMILFLLILRFIPGRYLSKHLDD